MTHRYVGVVIGLVMLMWFASGVVMLFVRWPEVTPQARAAALPPIPWARCCDFGPVADDQPISAAVVETLDGRPVLRVPQGVIDLATGQPLAGLGPDEAKRAAADFARGSGVHADPARADWVERDQWTVSGAFNDARPFWKVRLADRAATDLYVSFRTGEVVQRTDAPGRVLNWLGAIPHWLYPQILRHDVKLWSQVVIWLSIVGAFLTITGLYLGVVAWRPWRNERLTPFRGLMAWHHLAGLAAGLLTLSWVASGLVSMNPWGFLEGRPDHTAHHIAGEPSFGELKAAVLAAKARGLPVRQLRLAPLHGQAWLLADGVRLDREARPVPLAPADLAAIGRETGPVARQGMIRDEDAYYHSGHEGGVPLPAWRVLLRDGTRVYLDPASGEVRARFDADRRTYRWLFEGLHRLDFAPRFDSGPAWSAMMIALLAGAGLGVATGVWLGWRRIRADVGGLTRRRARRA